MKIPLILTLLLSGITACAAPKHGSAYVIGMSQCNNGEPWRVQMNADLKKAAAEKPNLQVIFKDAHNDTLTQAAQIEEFVNADVDLLIVSPKEAAPLTAPVANAFRQNIPVIVLDRRVLGEEFTQFIGADNRGIGEAAGRWVKQFAATLPVVKNGGHARLVELKGLMTSSPAQDRHAGFVAGLKGAPVDTVFAADMHWLEPQARIEMESALATHDQIEVVFAHNDSGLHGAYLAAKSAGREKAICFVGIDALPQEGQAYVREGLFSVSFEYPTGGREAIESAVHLLAGESVPKFTILESRAFTAESIGRGGDLLPRP